jgi:hypothetical protein
MSLSPRPVDQQRLCLPGPHSRSRWAGSVPAPRPAINPVISSLRRRRPRPRGRRATSLDGAGRYPLSWAHHPITIPFRRLRRPRLRSRNRPSYGARSRSLIGTFGRTPFGVNDKVRRLPFTRPFGDHAPCGLSLPTQVEVVQGLVFAQEVGTKPQDRGTVGRQHVLPRVHLRSAGLAAYDGHRFANLHHGILGTPKGDIALYRRMANRRPGAISGADPTSARRCRRRPGAARTGSESFWMQV